MTPAALRRIWLGVAALGVAVVLALSYFLLIGPQLAALQAARSDSDSLAAKNASTQAELRMLSEKSRTLVALADQLAVLRTELPTDNATGAFVSQLQTLGDKEAVSVTSYTVGEPQVVDSSAATTSSTADPTESGTSTSRSALYALPVTLTVRGNARGVDRFAADLLGGGTRAMLVTTSAIVPASGSATGSLTRKVIATYTGFVYVDRDASGSTDAAGGSAGG